VPVQDDSSVGGQGSDGAAAVPAVMNDMDKLMQRLEDTDEDRWEVSAPWLATHLYCNGAHSIALLGHLSDIWRGSRRMPLHAQAHMKKRGTTPGNPILLSYLQTAKGYKKCRPYGYHVLRATAEYAKLVHGAYCLERRPVVKGGSYEWCCSGWTVKGFESDDQAETHTVFCGKKEYKSCVQVSCFEKEDDKGNTVSIKKAAYAQVLDVSKMDMTPVPCDGARCGQFLEEMGAMQAE